MLKAFLDSLEDPKRPLVGPNYWLINKLCLIFSENRFGVAGCVFFPSLVGLFVFTEYLEIYYTRSDLDEVLTNLRISMLSAVCVAKGFSLIVWQKDWLQVINYVTEADKFERDTRDEVKGKILDKYTKYCRKFSYCYWCLTFATFFVTVASPLLIYISSKSYREELRNGTELFPHIFKSWYPFDKNSSPHCWIIVVYQTVFCAWGGAIMAAYDSNAVVILVFFGGKLDLMRERCKRMLGTDGQGISDDKAAQAIREMHQMHIDLMRHMKMMNSVMSPVMFMYVAMCSLMLCASTYQLTTVTNAVQLLPLGEYLLFGIAQLFIFCWHCNDVVLKNQDLNQGMFENEWWASPPRQRKNVHLLMGQMNMSHVFTAGPFTNLTLPTFITILKAAYSYYTLLRK